MNKEEQNKLQIRQLVFRWAFCRDRGLWPELSSCFHPNGFIAVSWYSGSFDGFVAASKKMAKKSIYSKHEITSPLIRIKNSRAICESSVIITAQRRLGLMKVGLISYARFYDHLEQKDGVWKIVKRTTIYEKDRMNSFFISFLYWLCIMKDNRKKYPKAYRFLAYNLHRQGYNVALDLPTDKSKKANETYQQGEKWLSS